MYKTTQRDFIRYTISVLGIPVTDYFDYTMWLMVAEYFTAE